MKIRVSHPPSSRSQEHLASDDKPGPPVLASRQEQAFHTLSGQLQHRFSKLKPPSLQPVCEDDPERAAENFLSSTSRSTDASADSRRNEIKESLPKVLGRLSQSSGGSGGSHPASSGSGGSGGNHFLSSSASSDAYLQNLYSTNSTSKGTPSPRNPNAEPHHWDKELSSRSGSRCWARLRGGSKPLTKRQRLFLLVTYGIFRTFAVVLPLLVFALLMAGPETRGAAKSVAGLSALVAICHGLLARSPLHTVSTEPPRKIEDMAVDLFEFTDTFSGYSVVECMQLVRQATAEELRALSLLMKMSRAEKQKRTNDVTTRRQRQLQSMPSFGSSGQNSSGMVWQSEGSEGKRLGTPAMMQKRSFSKLSSQSRSSKVKFELPQVSKEAGERHNSERQTTPFSSVRRPSRSHSSLSSSTQGNSNHGGNSNNGLGRSYSSLSSVHKAPEDMNSAQRAQNYLRSRSGSSNYLRSRSGLSNSPEKERRPLLQKDRSSSSIGLRKSVTSNTEISVSSFTDFSQRLQPFRIRTDSDGKMSTVVEEDSEGQKSEGRSEPPSPAAKVAPEAFVPHPRDLTAGSAKTLFVELELPSSLCSHGSSSSGGSIVSGTQSRFPSDASADEKNTKAGSNLRLPSGREMQSAVDCQSDAGMTYVSACDAVLGQGNSAGEMVVAEVVNLGKGTEGNNRMRIEFKSQCLRTQMEWQRQLLDQQRSLLDAMSTELEEAKQKISSSDQLKKDQKELLRSFRKIVTREVANDAPQNTPSGLPQFGVQVFIVEEDLDMRAELEELCKMCEYPYKAFPDLDSGLDAVKHWQMNTGVGTPGSKSSSRIRRTESYSNASKMVPLVLMGASMLQQIRPGWKDEDLFVALTSQVEEFEEVGRQLLAAGESEVRDLLREKGISEYLMHPVSMSCLRGVGGEVLRQHFGDEYLLVDTIGRGATGVVYRAKRLRDGDVFALKEISLRRLPPRARQEVATETALLLELSWPTVVYVVDAFVSSNDQLQYLLMPILEGGSLSQLVLAAEIEDCKISAEHVMEWYAQTLHGVSYLHWRGILHRDLKPANLLLAADERILQIGDLGSAARLPGPGPHPDVRSGVHKDVTTLVYSAPETLIHKVHYAGSDLWAVAVSFYEVLTLTCPHEPNELNSTMGLMPNPRTLSSEGRDVAGPVRMALRESDLVDAGVIEEIATEMEELMRADPFERPAASAIMARPGNQRRLWHVLRETAAFPDAEVEAEHLTYLNDIRKDAEAANLVHAHKEGQPSESGAGVPAAPALTTGSAVLETVQSPLSEPKEEAVVKEPAPLGMPAAVRDVINMHSI